MAYRAGMRLRFLILFCLAMPLTLAAQEAEPHPIDQKLAAAIDENPSTAGMIQAISEATEAWDAEMNRAYGALASRMFPNEFASLKEAQKAWIAYRDAQIDSIGKYYANMDGSMWRPVAANAVMELTRQRALFLQDMERLLDER